MYDFVDRPVASLSYGGRLLVHAMRLWTKAAGTGRCPCADVGPLFHKANLMQGFTHFHLMMTMLNRHAVINLGFGQPDRPDVTESEAVLLSLIRLSEAPAASAAAGAVAQIVGRKENPPLLGALAALGEALAAACLRPTPPIFDTGCASFPHE